MATLIIHIEPLETLTPRNPAELERAMNGEPFATIEATRPDVIADADHYVSVVNSAPNAWDQCICPKTGAQSHIVLKAGRAVHGRATFDLAVGDALKRNRKGA